MNREWFELWFGERYDALYQNRTQQQAERQVAFLLKSCGLNQPRVLDCGSGKGRHLNAYKSQGIKAWGLDYSEWLLKQSLLQNHQVVRSDIRNICFKDQSFNLLSSFFSSFGYFKTLAEDQQVLCEYSRVLKTNGYLFLDLINKSPVLKQLPYIDEQQINNDRVIQNRYLQNSRVIKEITWYGSNQSQPDLYREEVRLFELGDIKEMASNLGFKIIQVFGDESGAPYHASFSPRMSILFIKDGVIDVSI
jgi:ubiquinone/menaquinone biosynthesis C-methylase UbiE